MAHTAGFSGDPTATASGGSTSTCPYTYPSADDRADANYASQPAVNSYYDKIRSSASPSGLCRSPSGGVHRRR
jgi:hypothetical protein